jgi:alkylation response protein AidB-like acyl-CoA dehydrogenase
MDLDYTPEQNAFRAQVREFIAAKLPAEIRRKVEYGKRLSRDDYLRWQKILHTQGWGAAGWPEQFGGPGWDPIACHIFDEECAFAHAPIQLPFGLRMVGPVIMRFGSPAQQQRFLPRIVAGEDWWCQGYSEPGSGSDLASLKARAERSSDGAHYFVNGQKTWTTLAQHADWIFCLVRTATDVRPQEGISFVLIDMRSPGIVVRPIIMLEGEHEVNEVFFDNVKVPIENRVGEENKGWTYAKFLLGHERTGIAGVGRSKAALAQLKRLAHAQPADDGRPLIEDAKFRERLAWAELELMALEITNLKVLAAESAKSGEKQAPGPEASVLKIKGSEIQQTLTELTMQALGPYAAPHLSDVLDPAWHGAPLSTQFGEEHAAVTGQYFNYRKTTIYGGSNEIQKNIIAQMILGL